MNIWDQDYEEALNYLNLMFPGISVEKEILNEDIYEYIEGCTCKRCRKLFKKRRRN